MVRPTGSSALAAALAATACLSWTGSARADASAADQALAQSLFDEGRKLMAASDYTHACPKFAESERLDPGGGTLLNLALCHEGEGKTASAWTEFNEALSRALRDGRPERVARARERIAVLEPRLSRLTVTVSRSGPADVQVTVDGAAWGAAMRGVPVPVDPGPHLVVATAAAFAPWSTTVTLGPNGDAKTVVIPSPNGPVSPPPAPPSSEGPAAPPAETAPSAPGNALRTTGLVIGGVGVAGVGLGAVFGVLAMGKWNQQKSDCSSSTSCNSHGDALADHSSLVTDATVSTGAFVAGGALIAGGALLFLMAPTSVSSTTGLVVVPSLGPRDAALGVGGRF